MRKITKIENTKLTPIKRKRVAAYARSNYTLCQLKSVITIATSEVVETGSLWASIQMRQ